MIGEFYHRVNDALTVNDDLDIGDLVSSAVDELTVEPASTLDDVFAADRLAREFVYKHI